MFQTVLKWTFLTLFVLFLGVAVLDAQKETVKVKMHKEEIQITKSSKDSIIIDSQHPENAEDNNNTDKKIEQLIVLAESKLGNSYKPAATGPDHFDCSGFVYYLFREQNITIARTSIDQSKEGEQVYTESLKRGDLLFFDTADRKHVNHSGIYLGNGKFIHASSGKAYGVTISDLNGWYKDKFLWGIRKIEE